VSRPYTGRILRVDLTRGELSIDQHDEGFYRKYMGGSAWGTYYALHEIPKGVDPLGPENVLVLSLSVLTGLPISGLSRVTATARSPLTGAIGDSQAGGFWPAELKFAGYDGIVITGKSPHPVYLWIHDGDAELRDAGHLWGKTTAEVDAALKTELGDAKVQVLQTGPAGERLVRIAALINMANRANGRTGMGAVMGSKNLKAVAVRGKVRPKPVDADALRELRRWGTDHLQDRLGAMQKYGTVRMVSIQDEVGGLPSFNWTSGVMEGAKSIDGRTIYDEVLVDNDTCYACAVRCKRVVKIDDGLYKVDPVYGGPEYESAAALGSYCGVTDLPAVCKASELCNAYGVDTISCGATIAWAMECFEKGLLTAKDTDGVDLRFGNGEALVEMVHRIAKREGLGDLLAEGSARAAKKLGRGSAAFVVAAKGQEYPAHMPRVKPTLSLIYAVNPFGADHMSHDHDPAYDVDGYAADADRHMAIGLLDPQPFRSLNAERVRIVFYTQCLVSLGDTLNTCQFVWGPSWQLYGPNDIVSLVRAGTGWDVSLFELMKVGERRLNMMRAFNAREGFTKEDDTIPERILEPLAGGPSDGWKIDRAVWEAAKETYYCMAGWDPATGNPTRAKLQELGIEWVADEVGL